MQHRDLLIRSVLGLPCLVLASWLFFHSGGGYLGLFFIFPCLLAYGLIITPGLTSSMASTWQGFYMPERSVKPNLQVARAFTLRLRHLPDEALVEYEKEITLHPEDAELWIAAIDVAWLDLKDHNLAASLHRRALRATRSRMDWKRIHQAHLNHAERHADSEEWFDEERRQSERRLQLRTQIR